MKIGVIGSLFVLASNLKFATSLYGDNLESLPVGCNVMTGKRCRLANGTLHPGLAFAKKIQKEAARDAAHARASPFSTIGSVKPFLWPDGEHHDQPAPPPPLKPWSVTDSPIAVTWKEVMNDVIALEKADPKRTHRSRKKLSSIGNRPVIQAKLCGMVCSWPPNGLYLMKRFGKIQENHGEHFLDDQESGNLISRPLNSKFHHQFAKYKYINLKTM